MERLLKIVDGPMKGAEVALVSGTRVKVGSGDSCDIVIADSTLADIAFELDVSDRAVTLVTPSGLASELQDFEIRDFGSTAIAIGPAEGAWGDLWRKPAEDPVPASEEKPASESAPAEAPKPAEESPAEGGRKEPARRRRGGCLWIALLLLLLILALLWYFKTPATAYGRKALHFFNEKVPSRSEAQLPEGQGEKGAESSPETPAQVVALTQIASDYGLTLEDREGVLFLCGNLRRRTEKMAIRAMALAVDKGVRFDLSDDQSLRAAAEDTLYLVAGGSLKVVDATNRVVVIKGEVKGPAVLEKALRALNDDVPQIEVCDTSAVRLSSRLAADADVDEASDAESGGGDAAPPAKADTARNFPVAGILTSPYPCVVLTDGSRCLEGSVVGGFVLKKISAEELIFESAGQEVVWRP